MYKKTIIITLLTLVALTGQGQIKCHVEGKLETDAWGEEIFICEAGTDLRVVDEPRFHVKAKDGHFSYDIETDFPRLYDVFFLKQYETGRWFVGKFLAENCNVNVTMFADKKPRFTTNGDEGRKHAAKDSIEDTLTAGQSSLRRTSFRPLMRRRRGMWTVCHRHTSIPSVKS